MLLVTNMYLMTSGKGQGWTAFEFKQTGFSLHRSFYDQWVSGSVSGCIGIWYT